MIIARILRGEQSAFRELVEQYSRHVYQTAYSVLQDAKEAEDVSQETFVQVYTSLSHYRNEGFKSWLTRIAVHKAIDTKRRRSRRTAEMTVADEALLVLPSREEDILGRLIRQERRSELAAKIETLPRQHKEVVTAFYIQGKSYEQMAEEMQVALKTVESRLYRARQWIRQHWNEEEWR
ncbi:RNA polymerase sigma factor [Paenibacillus sp. P96]|uniref:RNA polymerase sigma factor n=1 Tax=Paenibacillus zeirhizosphaerae TaxID=2987519 RepID=A0ABT9FPE8_9BACL|nr:RNA polymerase sigma factor [Paenibacillus sp. P96]MDP4096603.1 RNA polymerase sigma factor [Paenibacillus sp. P96]